MNGTSARFDTFPLDTPVQFKPYNAEISSQFQELSGTASSAI